MSTEEEIKVAVRKLILEEMTLFAKEHRAEIVEREMTKWKALQQEKQQESPDDSDPELSELA